MSRYSSSSLLNARSSPRLQSVWIVCRDSPSSPAAPPGDTSRPPYLSNNAISFGSPPARFASGIVRRLSHVDRLLREFAFEVGKGGRNDRSPAVHDPYASCSQVALGF